MENIIREPQRKISPYAVKVWRISDTLSAVITIAILSILLVLQSYYNWADWLRPLFFILGIIYIISFLIEISIIPIYRQKTWRYEIDDNGIQIKYGSIFKKVHLIIPINKIYSVSTEQGILLRKYGLSNIKIGTLANVHEIPAIPEKEAIELRANIILLAGLIEEE